VGQAGFGEIGRVPEAWEPISKRRTEMKNILRSLMAAGLVIIGGGAAIQAQQADRVVKFEAPFAFEVENNKLPAGEYTVLMQGGWLQIQGKDRSSAAHALTMPVVSRESKPVAKSHVVFHNYQGRYFLAEIWSSGQEKGRELLETREEQQLAKRQEMVAVNVPLSNGGAK
jgi:hypothetical protein